MLYYERIPRFEKAPCWKVKLSIMEKPVKINRKEVAALLPRRGDAGTKGDFGTLLCVCGSRDMPGAALLSAGAALRCGVGLVALASVPPVLEAARQSLWEAVTLPLPADEQGHISAVGCARILEYRRATALLVGCGLGRSTAGTRLLARLARDDSRPIVIDADGLNALCGALPRFDPGRPAVLTPHMGEMARLTGIDAETLRQDRGGHAAALARQTGAVVVLKDSVTHIAAPDGRLWLLDRPNSGLAKGGSGDVLAGCIAAFLAQGLDAPTAALLGAAVHSRAGARAAERLGKYGMLPRDVIESIPAAIKELEEGIL